MKLFEKLKNKLGIIALVGLLFQLIMPIYQVYVFAQENSNIETVQAESDDLDNLEVIEELETEHEVDSEVPDDRNQAD